MQWVFEDSGVDWSALSELYRIAPLGNKSAEYLHELCNVETGELHGTSLQTTVLFDLNARAAAPLTDEIRRRGKALGLEA